MTDRKRMAADALAAISVFNFISDYRTLFNAHNNCPFKIKSYTGDSVISASYKLGLLGARK